MRFNLELTIEGSKTAEAGEFIELVKAATSLMQAENGRRGNFEAVRKLIRLDPKGEALVIGDLHGDLDSLQKILESNSNLRKLNTDPHCSTIFLGDYGDRGSQSVEVYFTILRLKMTYPNQVILLRGNHEGPENLIASPHDLPLQLENRFGEKGSDAYVALRRLFDFLPNSLIVPSHFLMVHGGISQSIKNVHDLEFTGSLDNHNLLEELLWNDPSDQQEGVSPSPRGAGFLFGKDVTNTVLSNLGVKILIRGHEPAEEGYKIDHDGKVLTLFSRKGPPYFNTCGAYLNVPLAHEFHSASQLITCIHKF